jgi:small subunit ribosomal protein S3
VGHKTHPLGFRLGITQENRSFWYSKLKDYSKIIQEDYAIREIVLKSLSDKSIKHTGISKIIINRNSAQDQVELEIQTARPGILVGESGLGLETIDRKLNNLLEKKKVLLKIIEITDPYKKADILAEVLVEQLEKRVPFRRAMKSTIERAQLENVPGIKVQISGRLNGAEIARTEWLREGRVPLQTLRADIDYSYKTAQTIYGILGIKVWLFKGEILTR